MPQGKNYLKPGFILSKIINPLLIASGFIPTFSVKGRNSGKWIRTPITPLEYKGDLYLVSTRGESQWVRNLRSDLHAKITMKRKTKSVLASEVQGKFSLLRLYHRGLPRNLD